MGAHEGEPKDDKGGDSNRPQGGSHAGGKNPGGNGGDGNQPGR